MSSRELANSMPTWEDLFQSSPAAVSGQPTDEAPRVEGAEMPPEQPLDASASGGQKLVPDGAPPVRRLSKSRLLPPSPSTDPLALASPSDNSYSSLFPTLPSASTRPKDPLSRSAALSHPLFLSSPEDASPSPAPPTPIPATPDHPPNTAKVDKVDWRSLALFSPSPVQGHGQEEGAGQILGDPPQEYTQAGRGWEGQEERRNTGPPTQAIIAPPTRQASNVAIYDEIPPPPPPPLPAKVAMSKTAVPPPAVGDLNPSSSLPLPEASQSQGLTSRPSRRRLLPPSPVPADPSSTLPSAALMLSPSEMSYSSLFSRPTSTSTSAATGLKGTQEEGVGGAGILGRFQEQQVRDAHAHRGPTEALTFGDAGADFGDLQGPHKGAGLSRRVALHEAIFGKAQPCDVPLLEEGLAGMAPSVAAAIVKEAGRVQEDGQAQVWASCLVLLRGYEAALPSRRAQAQTQTNNSTTHHTRRPVEMLMDVEVGGQALPPLRLSVDADVDTLAQTAVTSAGLPSELSEPLAHEMRKALVDVCRAEIKELRGEVGEWEGRVERAEDMVRRGEERQGQGEWEWEGGGEGTQAVVTRLVQELTAAKEQVTRLADELHEAQQAVQLARLASSSSSGSRLPADLLTQTTRPTHDRAEWRRHMEEKASILRRFNAEREQLNTDMDRLRRQLGPQDAATDLTICQLQHDKATLQAKQQSLSETVRRLTDEQSAMTRQHASNEAQLRNNMAALRAENARLTMQLRTQVREYQAW